MQSRRVISMITKRRTRADQFLIQEERPLPTRQPALDLWKISNRVRQLPARVRETPSTLAHQVVFSEAIIEILVQILSELQAIKNEFGNKS